MRIYSLNNIEMVHISEAAQTLNRSIRYMRHLVEEGNQIRPIKFFRDRSRLMIPIIEMKGFPFTAGGYSAGQSAIYHFTPPTSNGTEPTSNGTETADGSWIQTLCEKCSFTNEFCEARQRAEDLVVPEGDK